MAEPVTLPALPLFVRIAGRAVVLVGEGEAADAKRRLLERAGAIVVGEEGDARLGIVAVEDEGEAVAAVARLKARGMLVNAVDRPALCDFTLPAIVDRAPVVVAIGTDGTSAGLAAALRQRLEGLLPAGLGRLAERLQGMRGVLRARYPEAGERRRAIAGMLAEGGVFDPFRHAGLDPVSMFPQEPEPSGTRGDGPRLKAGVTDVSLADGGSWNRAGVTEVVELRLSSPDPDELTLRQARLLANADRVFHTAQVPDVILNRARADAERTLGPVPADPGAGLTVTVSL